MATLLFLSVHVTGCSPTGLDPEIRATDQEIGSPGRPVSSGLQVPVICGFVVQEQVHLGEIPATFFLQNVLQLHQQR
jgi:hypothetical protein